MTTLLDGLVGKWPWCICALAVLGLALGGAGTAWGQVVDDSTRAQPTGVEPAELDTLPTDDLGPPPRAPADTGRTERAYVNADSLSTFRRGGERLQELFGNVFVRQDTTRLRSEYALRYLNRDEVLFTDSVVIYERGDTLRADTVRYDRATEVGHARGHVRLTNGDVEVRSDRATYYAQRKRSVFPDSVTLIDSSRVLRAQHGTYWSDEERAEFGGTVRLTEPGTTLLSDSLTYYRNRDRSIARGRVFVDRRGGEEAATDTTSRTYLFGDWVDNREAQRYSRVEGNALLARVRMDSTGAPTDTLLVRARRLEAFRTDTHRRLVAVNSVRIWQPNLSAVADSAVYDRVLAPSPDSVGPETVPIDTTRTPADSVARPVDAPSPGGKTPRQRPTESDSLDNTEGKDADSTRTRASPDTTNRRSPSTEALSPDSLVRPQSSSRSGRAPAWTTQRWKTPVVRADSALPLEETRLFRSPIAWFESSQVWGDSIRVRARDREPDTVFVRGAAFAAQRDSVLDRIQQLKAQHIGAFFEDGSLRRTRAEPSAQAIRFLAAENDSLNGAARTSGDRIILRFRNQSVRRIRVIGGTQTTYYRENENIPDPFELNGFQWTPERRPKRRELLQDPRVLERLELDPDSVSPRGLRSGTQPASEAPQSSAADSTDRSSRREGRVPPPRRQSSSRRVPADSSRRGTTLPPDSVEPSAGGLPPTDTSETHNFNP